MAQCEGIAKKTGERCTRPTAKGGALCAGHAGMGIAADPGAHALAGNAASARMRAERAQERKMSLLDRMAAEIEARAEEIVGRYLAAGERGDWRALEALVTRVHGKPVERVQVEADPDPFQVASMTQAERSALMAQVLQAYPHLAPLAGTSLVHGDPQSLH